MVEWKWTGEIIRFLNEVTRILNFPILVITLFPLLASLSNFFGNNAALLLIIIKEDV
jgi:ABC-type methionine transport system permease subunit